MRLTKIQKEMVLSASRERDYCCKGGTTSMQSLVEKGLAKYTSGFGWKHGKIVELTDLGKQVRADLLKEKRIDRLIGDN